MFVLLSLLRAWTRVKNERSFYTSAMPRVSDEHLAARRQQILDAAWRCFARQGFHATSMQDVFAEAGLSAGAVYRYFPSKKALIQATAQSILGTLDAFFDELRDRPQAPTLPDLMRLLTEQVLTLAATDPVDRTRVAMNVWAEALREPDVGETAAATLQEIRDRFADVVRRWQSEGRLGADVDPDNVARVLYGLTAGFLVQRLIAGDMEPAAYADGIAALMKMDSAPA